MIIFIIFTGALLIVLILACAEVIKHKHRKFWLYIALFLWICYSCFFWAAFTLQIQGNQAKDGIFCSLNSLINNSLYGNTGSPEEFIGIKNLYSSFNNMGTTIDALAG